MHNNDLLRHHGLALVPSHRHLLGFFVVMQGVMLAALVANAQAPLDLSNQLLE
jgi:hypothetical protein